MLRKGHVLLDLRLAQRNQIKYATTKPTNKFVVKPEIEFVQQDRHFEFSSHNWGHPSP